MAGRNISASHVAFTSTRVMATCAVVGQAAGTAAALVQPARARPRGRSAKTRAGSPSCSRALLRDDQSIDGLANEDARRPGPAGPGDGLGRPRRRPAAKILDGYVRDASRRRRRNRWSAPLESDGAWIELAWDQPQSVRHVQITFDTGFQRELTLTASDAINKGIIRAPQPETVRDYRLLAQVEGQDGWKELAAVTGNHQRLRRHDLDPVAVRAIRLQITATNGDPLARVFEIRCYG